MVGVVSGLLLGLIFLLSKRQKAQFNIFLAMLFFLLSIRLGKLYFQEYSYGIVRNAYFNLMQAAYFALGPVLWLYIQSYLNHGRPRRAVWHFLPAFVFLFGAFFIRYYFGESFWLLLYLASLIHPFVYLFLSLRLIIPLHSRIQKRWLGSLIFSLTLIALANVLFFFFEFPFYLLTSLLLLITTYLFVYLGVNHRKLLRQISPANASKYANLKRDDHEFEHQFELIKNWMEEKKLYLQPQLSLEQLSEKTGLTTHQISGTVNYCSGKNFPDFVNTYRLEEARRLLLAHPKKKIIAVAYESGFHSISSFNQLFRKKTGMSPSAFRKKHRRSSPDL